MRTGLTKREKTTAIYFDEYGSMIEVQTHNTDLKKRLSAFAAKYPECCRQIDDDEQGGLTFEIKKGRLLSVKMLSQSRLLAHFKSNSTISGLIRFCLELRFCLLSIGFLKIKQSVYFPRKIPSSLKSTKQKFAQIFLLCARRLI